MSSPSPIVVKDSKKPISKLSLIFILPLLFLSIFLFYNDYKIAAIPVFLICLLNVIFIFTRNRFVLNVIVYMLKLLLVSSVFFFLMSDAVTGYAFLFLFVYNYVALYYSLVLN